MVGGQYVLQVNYLRHGHHTRAGERQRRHNVSAWAKARISAGCSMWDAALLERVRVRRTGQKRGVMYVLETFAWSVRV